MGRVLAWHAEALGSISSMGHGVAKLSSKNLGGKGRRIRRRKKRQDVTNRNQQTVGPHADLPVLKEAPSGEAVGMTAEESNPATLQSHVSGAGIPTLNHP